MRRLLLWSSVAGFTACLLQPTLATITPDYGYADGCVQVVIQGHHLGENATARMVGAGGEAEFLDLQPAEKDPEVPEHAQDVGFKYFGTAPASPDGGTGWYDVVLTVDGEDLTINDGWYYRGCPGPIWVDAYDIPVAAAVTGDAMTFNGCNLTEDTELQFVDPLTGDVTGAAPLTSLCTTAVAEARVPDMPAGIYNLRLSNGTDLYRLQVCVGGSGVTGYAHSGGHSGGYAHSAGDPACDPVTINVTAR